MVGLGNPGIEYEWSRHNLGFMLIDKLGKAAGVGKFRRECQSLTARAEIGSKAVLLVKPQTYMNLSGESVSCLFKKYEATAADLIVVSDDLALPFGKIRIRARGVIVSKCFLSKRVPHSLFQRTVQHFLLLELSKKSHF